MNKKVLVLTLILLAIPLLTVLPVQAEGKGTEKLYFKLYVVGLPNYATGERWLTPDPTTGPMAHGRDVEWLPPDVLEVTIGSNTYSPPAISYSCKIDADYNIETFVGVQRVRETITFYSAESSVWGTLEILAIGKLGAEGATFTGHGTGALEGVKVEGTNSAEIIPWPGPPGVRLAVTRVGTVMGWP